MKKISILIPAYNESGNLEKLVRRLNALTHSVLPPHNGAIDVNLGDYEWEYVFVNDGSKDDTFAVLRQLRKDEPRVNIVNLSRNFGKENALLAGMDYTTGDAVIIMDAELQHPVSSIPEKIYWWEQGYDDVYGRRSDRGKESWLRRRPTMNFNSLNFAANFMN